MKLRRLIVMALYISFCIFTIQPNNLLTQDHLQQQFIEQVQKENEEMYQQIQKLEKEVDLYRNDVRSNLALWLAFLTIIMALLGVAIPVILNLRNEHNIQKQLDEAKTLAKSAIEESKKTDFLKEEIEKNKKAAENAERNAKASVYFAQALSEKDLNKAIEYLNKAIELRPDFYEAFFNRGVLRFKSGDLEGSMLDFNKAITLKSDYGEAFYFRGVLKETQNDISGAMLDYNKAIDLNPEDAEAYYKRALLKFKSDDLDGALEDFDKSIFLKPEDGRTHNGKAVLLLSMGDLGNALDDANQAIQYDSSNYQYFVTRGEIYMNMDNYEMAIDDFTYAQKLNDKSNDIRQKIARCYRRLAEDEQDVTKKTEYIFMAENEETASSHMSFVNQVMKKVANATGQIIVKVKRNVYCSEDRKIGYVYCESKAYKQGKRLKFWYGYRKKPLELIKGCEKQYMIYSCRDTGDVLLIPVKDVESHLSQLSSSTNDKGDIIHWHIVLLKDAEGHFSQLLPKSETREINIDKYIIN